MQAEMEEVEGLRYEKYLGIFPMKCRNRGFEGPIRRTREGGSEW
jgi:hypothetical protein